MVKTLICVFFCLFVSLNADLPKRLLMSPNSVPELGFRGAEYGNVFLGVGKVCMLWTSCD